MQVIQDPRFEEHFSGRLRQVFIYVTDVCNLRCSQCYYKPWLRKWSPDAEMSFEVLEALLREFRRLGAIKASFLGGEPTQYGIHGGPNPTIDRVVELARSLGYSYLRIVTNGLWETDFAKTAGFEALDEVTISIDGHEKHIHDAVRGNGTFDRTIPNVHAALDAGLRVHVTTCVHRLNSGWSETDPDLHRAVRWAEGLGVALINFHPLFKMGIARDSWTEANDIDPDAWRSLYQEMRGRVSAGAYSIPVRLPQRFVSARDFDANPEFYGYCPVKLAERLEVHTNGQLHSCALHNGTSVSLARFSRERDALRVRWADHLSEIDEYEFDFTRHHPCVVMRKDFEPAVPLCISFKPDQEEPVWQLLGIDELRCRK